MIVLIKRSVTQVLFARYRRKMIGQSRGRLVLANQRKEARTNLRHEAFSPMVESHMFESHMFEYPLQRGFAGRNAFRCKRRFAVSTMGAR